MLRERGQQAETAQAGHRVLRDAAKRQRENEPAGEPPAPPCVRATPTGRLAHLQHQSRAALPAARLRPHAAWLTRPDGPQNRGTCYRALRNPRPRAASTPRTTAGQAVLPRTAQPCCNSDGWTWASPRARNRCPWTGMGGRTDGHAGKTQRGGTQLGRGTSGRSSREGSTESRRRPTCGEPRRVRPSQSSYRRARGFTGQGRPRRRATIL